MGEDINSIKSMIVSKYKAHNKKISDEKLEDLVKYFEKSDKDLLYIQEEIEVIISEEEKDIFNTEEIGDELAFMQLKQLDIDKADEYLKKVSKNYRDDSKTSQDENVAFGRENKIRFSTEEIGDNLAFMELKQFGINKAERVLKYYIDQKK